MQILKKWLTYFLETDAKRRKLKYLFVVDISLFS